MLADTWYLFNKYFRITMRMPLWSLFTLIQPLIWLFIFGALFQNFADLPGFPADSYIDFFVPGVLIMTVLFGSSWSGVSLLREITAGTVDKMLVSPVSRTSIVLSRVLHSAVQVVAQTFLILVVAWIIGADVSMNPLDVLGALVIVLLLGVSFASISNGLAITLEREEPLVVIGNMMTLPLMFFSTALVPVDFMPGWIRYITVINPIDYAVTSVRSVLVESSGDPFAVGLIVLALFAVATLAWAISAFGSLKD